MYKPSRGTRPVQLVPSLNKGAIQIIIMSGLYLWAPLIFYNINSKHHGFHVVQLLAVSQTRTLSLYHLKQMWKKTYPPTLKPQITEHTEIEPKALLSQTFRKVLMLCLKTPEKPQAVPEFQLAAEYLPFVPVSDRAAGQYLQGSLPRQPRRWEAVNHTASRAGDTPDEFLLECFQLLQLSGPELVFFPASNEKPPTWRLHYQSVFPRT